MESLRYNFKSKRVEKFDSENVEHPDEFVPQANGAQALLSILLRNQGIDLDDAINAVINTYAKEAQKESLGSYDKRKDSEYIDHLVDMLLQAGYQEVNIESLTMGLMGYEDGSNILMRLEPEWQFLVAVSISKMPHVTIGIRNRAKERSVVSDFNIMFLKDSGSIAAIMESGKKAVISNASNLPTTDDDSIMLLLDTMTLLRGQMQTHSQDAPMDKDPEMSDDLKKMLSDILGEDDETK